MKPGFRKSLAGESSYSPSIAQDLLSGTNEWVNIQDIVKLTFKALFDVVKAQGEALRDLEQIMPTKASRTEMNSALSQKANISDVSKTIAEIASSIESKVSLEELQLMLAEKLDKKDAEKVLKSGDMEYCIKETKILESDLNRLTSAVEFLQKDMGDKLSSIQFNKQIEEIKAELKQKLSLAEFTNELSKKASKESVANALQKKADKKETELLFSKKVDLSDLDKIVSAVERKVDQNDLEIIQKRVEMKIADLDNFMKEITQKVSGKDLDIAISSVSEVQRMEREKLAIELEKNINELRKIVNEDSNFIHNSMVLKADLDSIKEKHTQINLEAKKNTEDLRNELLELSKHLRDSMEPELARLGNVIDYLREDANKVRDTLNATVEDKKREYTETQKYFSNISTNVKAQLDDETRVIHKEINGLRKDLDNVLSKTCDRKELSNFKAAIQQLLDPKADINEVQQAITESQTLVARRIAELREELAKDINQIKEECSRKASMDYVVSNINNKVDQTMLVAAIQEKANVSDLEILVSRVNGIQGDLERKLDHSEYEQHENEEKDQLAELKKDLLLKANIKDVCTLVDIKANSEDLKKAITELHMEIEKKTNSDDFSAAMSDLSLLHEALCAENCVGRWVWKSGELKNGYAVPWEAQCVNTCPDNFLWEKDKTSVMTIAAGLYEIKAGFFAAKIDKIQVLVNGEPAKTILGPQISKMEPASSLKGKISSKSVEEGNLTGIFFIEKAKKGTSVVDFLALPPRARIGISYSGDVEAEGFLSLKKL